MRPGARLAAAIEVMTEVIERHRPASDALGDWGKSHRFAGSGDRAAIGNLVYDALRRRLSLGARMSDDRPRALILAAAPDTLQISPDAVAALADGSAHTIEPLTAAELDGLGADLPENLPDHVLGDIPDWLAGSFGRVFGDRTVSEGAALAKRAPVDLRANALKCDRGKLLAAMERFNGETTWLSPVCVRIPVPDGPRRTPNVEAEPAHGKGWFEVQDEGSQVAALMTGVGPRMQVLDLCAGAGGKTLALSAAMQNKGQIYAYDSNRQQLRPIFERMQRAGSRNIQVIPAGEEAALTALGARFDVVLVDAPCTGSGVWRRRPDAKWRVKPANLAERLVEQQAVLALAAPLVKPGGRLVYVTCSVLAEENTESVDRFLASTPGFEFLPYGDVWRQALPDEPPASSDGRVDGLLLTPASHATDGFYIATLRRGD